MNGDLKPLGPDDPDLLSLAPDRFEDLVFLLAHAEDSGVVPVRAWDHGLDARLPTDAGRATSRGWQAKRYTGPIKFEKCRESVKRAMAFWRPRQITFCFPRELSAKEQDDFREQLVDRFPQVRIDFWSGKELKRRLRDSEEGRRAARFLFGDPTADVEAMRRALATGGELTSADQALGRLGVINRFIQADPHFRYAVEVTEQQGPQSTPAPETVVSVEVEVDDSRIRLDASERYRGATEKHGPMGAIVFDDAESARKAREELGRISREGGSTVLDSGVGIRMDRVPQGLAALFPDELFAASVEITALPRDRDGGVPGPVPIMVAAGDTEVAIDLTATEPPEDWERGVRGELGGLEIVMLMRPGAETGRVESRIDWRHTLGRGSTMEQLLSLELMLAAYAGEPVELRAIDTGAVLLSGTIDESTGDPEINGLKGRLELLGLLAEIEAWAGEHLDPPAQWKDADIDSVVAAIPWIRKPLRENLEDIRIDMTFKPGALPLDPAEPHQFAVVQSLAIELFGRELYLGERMLHLPRGQLVEIVESKRTGVVVPVDGTHGSVRLFPPDESPPRPPGPPEPD